MRAILIILVLLASLGWIAYASNSLVEKEKNAFHPEFVFNKEDSAVLIINRWQELNQPQEILNNGKNQLLSLNFPAYLVDCKFYFSGQRNLLILEKKGDWSKDEINKLGSDLSLAKNELYYSRGSFVVLSKKEFEFNKEKVNFFNLNDKNASANLVVIENNSNTDIYKTSEGNYQYRSKLDNKAMGKAVNDELNFAYVVPEDVESYRFYQYAYLADVDSVFAKGPMFKWIDKGVVRAKLNGEEFLICDYLPQQNPVLILLENSEKVDTNYLTQEAKHFQGFDLLKDFPKSESIYVLAVEDKVVIAESKGLCEQIALHYKLGKTLALNPQKKKRIFGELTKEVHFRIVEDAKAKALSYSEKQSFSVSKIELAEGVNEPREREVLTVALDNPPLSITPIVDHIRGGNSIFVTLENGAYVLISKQGEILWKGNANQRIDHVSVVDVYQNKKHQIAYSTKNSFGIIDLNGNNVNGFPVQFESSLTTRFSAVSWRGQSKFILGTSTGEVIMLNAKGMELMVQNPTQDPLKGDVIGINRKGTLSAWVRTENNAFCVELEKTKIKAKANNIGELAVKAGGDVTGGAFDNYRLKLKNISGDVLQEIAAEKAWADDKYFYVLVKGELHILSAYGDELMKLNKSNQEISKVHSFEVAGNYYTLLLDKLENNIYLFNNKGNLVKNWPKKGEGIVSFVYSENSKELKVYSAVDQNLIAYSYQFN